MDTQIINKPLEISIYGFAGTAVNKDYAATAFRLMDSMWKIVKSQNIPNEGKNIWVYEPGEQVFAGVELKDIAPQNSGLEYKKIILNKYAYYKHIGPYNLISQAGLKMRKDLAEEGYELSSIYIEIYGHATPTDSETELIMALK
jgi:predicted transcriptional regulator YdeE